VTGTRRWTDIAAALQAIAARDPQAILPYSYAGTMGLVQGEAWPRASSTARRVALDRTICASAGGEALTPPMAARSACTGGVRREPLILIWGSNSIASNLHFWTYAQQAKRNGAKLVCIDPRAARRPTSATSTSRLRPAPTARWRWADARADRTTGWTTTTSSATRGLARASCASARCSGRPSAPPRSAASADEVRQLARDYGTTQPAAIRLNYGMQRVHGGGNAVRLVALLPCAHGRLAPPRRRAAAVQLGLVPAATRALQRPDLLAGRRRAPST
jgi:anaerobic selenocysteine-containing dehydrogenase